MAEINDVLHETDIPRAYMVPVGKNVDNALPLLTSLRFSKLIRELKEHADYVLVDAAPIGTVIDAAEIAKSCDGSLIVVNSDKVHKRELSKAKEQLLSTGCPIIGAVLNQVELRSLVNRHYYYKSYYSHYETYYTTEEDKNSDTPNQ